MRRLFGNGFHAMASTGLSGLVNVVLQLAVGSILPAAAFGRFSLAAVTILFVVGGARMLIGQTDILRGATGRDAGAVNAAWTVAGVVLAAGGVLVLVAAADPDGTLFTLGLATAASAVFVVQDNARYRAFREQRAVVASTSDVVVLLAAVPGVYLLSTTTGDVVHAAVLVWTAATALGCVPAVVALRYWPTRPRQRWLHRHRDLVRPGGVEYLMQTGMPYLANWIIALVVSYDALAGYRLVQLVFAAVSNVAVGLQAGTLPRIAATADAGLVRSLLTRQRLALTGIAGAAALGLVLLPEDVGTAVLGDSWALTGPFVAPVAVHGAVNALAVMNFAVLRHAGRSAYLLTVRAWSVVATAAGVLAGVLAFGAVGAAWAMALVALGAYVARVVVERRVLREWGQVPVPVGG